MPLAAASNLITCPEWPVRVMALFGLARRVRDGYDLWKQRGLHVLTHDHSDNASSSQTMRPLSGHDLEKAMRI